MKIAKFRNIDLVWTLQKVVNPKIPTKIKENFEKVMYLISRDLQSFDSLNVEFSFMIGF